MIQCPKCGASATQGASDCAKCGYGFSAVESDPGFSPQKLFKWWLGVYAFWRVLAAVTNGLAAFGVGHAPSQVFFAGVALLAVASLAAIIMLWRTYKPALFLFIGAEVLSAGWVALHGDFLSAIYPLIAAAVMWFVSQRAWAPANPAPGPNDQPSAAAHAERNAS